MNADNLPVSPPFDAAFNLVDAGVRVAEGWLEWQRAMWQPVIDMQAAWLHSCSQAADALSYDVPERGGEQLA